MRVGGRAAWLGEGFGSALAEAAGGGRAARAARSLHWHALVPSPRCSAPSLPASAGLEVGWQGAHACPQEGRARG